MEIPHKGAFCDILFIILLLVYLCL